MSLACRFLASAWQTAATPRWRAFRRALRAPHETQERLLLGLVRDNRDTWIGCRHGFARIRSAEEFQRRVPLTDWDDYRDAVDRIRRGENGVLTAEPVTRLVPSSGSSAARKLVPYTGDLLRRFQAAIAPWIVDLFRHRPALKAGPAYWSVSPAIGGEEGSRVAARGKAAIPIGFDDDSAYLGAGVERLVARTLAVPAEVRFLTSGDAFYHATALFLLASSNLRLISVWHPSFLDRLLERARESWPRLLADLERGTLSLSPGAGATRLERRALARLAARCVARPERARQLAAVGSDDPASWWPDLGLVSCWSDGPAEPAATALARRLPAVAFQPKGLVATEAIVSLPFGDSHPLAVRSHFFEFLDPSGRARLAGELESGRSYSLVVTNGAGLYRYRLNDRVRVTGFLERTPCLRFEGREEILSDHRGEKLNGLFVERALRRAFDEAAGPRLTDLPFVLVAPEGSADGVMGYVLFVEIGEGDGESGSEGETLGRLAAALERRLGENPYYDLCRRLGQLDAVRALPVRNGAEGFLRRRRQDGLRLGDVKPTWLSPRTGWCAWFGLDATGTSGS